MPPPEVLLRKHTRRELRTRMERGELQACIVPVAAVEQHLEHLAMEHDWASVTHIAVHVAERLRPRVLVAEGLLTGISEHHMRHPGTLSLRPGTFLAVVHDLIDSVVRAGFKHVLVLNGHGGNTVPLRSNWDQLLRLFQVNLHFLPYWEVLGAEDAKLLEGGQRLPDDLPGHAQEFETSFALAAFPANVRTDMWRDQPDPRPALATAEKGRELIARIVERVAAYVEDMIEGRRVAAVPPFYP
jgi:creatinine amidohydrolase